VDRQPRSLRVFCRIECDDDDIKKKKKIRKDVLGLRNACLKTKERRFLNFFFYCFPRYKNPITTRINSLRILYIYIWVYYDVQCAGLYYYIVCADDPRGDDKR